MCTADQPGIGWDGVGNRYVDNYVGHAPHNGFLGGGNEASLGAGCNCLFDNNVRALRTTQLIVFLFPVPSSYMYPRFCLLYVLTLQTIDTVSYECSDTGSFYTCGQQATAWANRGNVLRNSVFKKIRNTTPFHLGAPSVQAICKIDSNCLPR